MDVFMIENHDARLMEITKFHSGIFAQFAAAAELICRPMIGFKG